MPRIPRKWKDPQRPKRGMSAFMIYSNEVRTEVKLANPGLAFGDVAREIARLWADLPFERKEHYGRLSEEDRRRYEVDMKDYTAPPTPKDKLRKFRDPHRPKRGMSAFMIFSNEVRSRVKADNPSLAFGDVAREIARIWKESPLDVHQRFTRLADEDRSRYEMQMADYRPPPPVVDEARRRKKRAGGMGEPRRPRSPFMMYCQIERPGLKETNPHARMADLTAALAERWKSMTDVEKVPYVHLAANDKSRYDDESADHRLQYVSMEPPLAPPSSHPMGMDAVMPRAAPGSGAGGYSAPATGGGFAGMYSGSQYSTVSASDYRLMMSGVSSVRTHKHIGPGAHVYANTHSSSDDSDSGEYEGDSDEEGDGDGEGDGQGNAYV